MIATSVAALVLVAAPGAGARAEVTVARLGGTTRIETAVALSKSRFGPTTYDAWLARADAFPDALVASAPAGFFNGGGPILLTPSDHLHPSVREELERLDTQRVFILGSDDVISGEVEAEIAEMGIDRFRISGRDRYQTAAGAASTMAGETFQMAFLATGADFADSLAAGPLAYILGRPIFLTTPDELHPSAAQGFLDTTSRKITILGGSAAVSERVERQVEETCYNPGTPEPDCVEVVGRIGGRDRTETATLLADELLRQTDYGVGPPTHVNLARGDAFPDGVAGAPHAGEELAPILLTAGPDTLGDATREWLESYKGTIETLDAFGTADALSDRVLEEARAAASGS